MEIRAQEPSVVAWTRTGRFDALLSRLGIERRAESTAAEGSFVLVESEVGFELRPPEEWDRPGVYAALPPDRGKSASAAPRHPLARAFGKKIATVYDVTAGLGGDAYRLAAAGYRVRASERHPVVYALLASAWEMARASQRIPGAIEERLAFEWAEAADVIGGIEARELGVYLDPMYPAPRRSSALPKRRLQVLRALVGEGAGDETESVALLAQARKRAARVVVKRPHHAPPLMADVGFTIEIERW